MPRCIFNQIESRGTHDAGRDTFLRLATTGSGSSFQSLAVVVAIRLSCSHRCLSPLTPDIEGVLSC